MMQFPRTPTGNPRGASFQRASECVRSLSHCEDFRRRTTGRRLRCRAAQPSARSRRLRSLLAAVDTRLDGPGRVRGLRARLPMRRCDCRTGGHHRRRATTPGHSRPALQLHCGHIALVAEDVGSHVKGVGHRLSSSCGGASSRVRCAASIQLQRQGHPESMPRASFENTAVEYAGRRIDRQQLTYSIAESRICAGGVHLPKWWRDVYLAWARGTSGPG